MPHNMTEARTLAKESIEIDVNWTEERGWHAGWTTPDGYRVTFCMFAADADDARSTAYAAVVTSSNLASLRAQFAHQTVDTFPHRCPRCKRGLERAAQRHFVTYMKPVYSPIGGTRSRRAGSAPPEVWRPGYGGVGHDDRRPASARSCSSFRPAHARVDV